MREDGKSSQKLTIAHFMPWSELGGVEIATLRMTDITHGEFRHVAFCLHDAIALRSSFEKMGIETITYSPPVPSLRHAVRFYKESRAVARQIQTVRADIVHFSEANAAEQNSLAAFLAGSRVICHVRNTYPHLTMRQRIPLLPVHSFIFVSEESRRHFAVSFPDAKARVIYDAIELPAADIVASNAAVKHELGIPDGCSVVGMVARVNPQKDYFTLASAAAEVLNQYPNTRFLIVGDNSLVELNRNHYNDVMRELEKFGIADKFIFTGHRNDVTRLIAAMDFCVLSTHREGFPLSILESMAMGKPVIATAVGGIPEIVTPGVTGYLHQHGNGKELAEAIMSLIEDPAKTAKLGLAAYENVRENYSRQKYADEISRVYSDVIRR